MMRLPVIRHIRWFVLNFRLQRFLNQWASAGFLRIPSQADLDYLDAVWRGDK